jgi:hypothetical protein
MFPCRQVVRLPKISDVRSDELDGRGIAIELRAGLSRRECRDEEDADRKGDSSCHDFTCRIHGVGVNRLPCHFTKIQT